MELKRSSLIMAIFAVTIISLIGFSNHDAYATNITAVASGNWNNNATWGGTVPISTDHVSIPNGITVTIPLGLTVTVAFNGTITNSGTINTNGTITNFGAIANYDTITNSGAITNNGTITNNFGTIINNNSGGLITNNNNIINSGTININSGGLITNNNNINTNGTITNLSGGTIDNPGGTIANNFGGTITNSGTLNNSGTNNPGGTANNFGGTITNSGTINNLSGGIINSDGGGGSIFSTITNTNTISNDGIINNSAGIITVGNHGIINNNSGGLINNFYCDCPGGRTIINAGGAINNYGTFNNAPLSVLTNNGTFTNFCGSTFTGTGTVDGTTPVSNIPCAPAATISFDKPSYGIDQDTGILTIADASVPGTTNIISASLTSTTDTTPFPVSLTRVPATNTFVSAPIVFVSASPSVPPNFFYVVIGDVVTVTYSSVSTNTATISGHTGVVGTPLPLALDATVYYPEGQGTITVFDTTGTVSSSIRTVTANLTSSADAGCTRANGHPITLTETAVHSNTFTGNAITYSQARSTDCANLVLHVKVPPAFGEIIVKYTTMNGLTTYTRTANVVSNVTPQLAAPGNTGVTLSCNNGQLTDTVNDGLCDEWKTATGLRISYTNPSPLNTVTYSFPCNPNASYVKTLQTANTAIPYYNALGDQVCPDGTRTIRDVYVQVSWMQGQSVNPTALADVVQAYYNQGIDLHIQVDPGAFTHSDSISINGAAPSFFSLKPQLFLNSAERKICDNAGNNPGIAGGTTLCSPANVGDLVTAKRQAFHYAMYVQNISDAPGASGWGEIWGHNFIVSLGSFTGQVGSVGQQEGTFMHELGHNLNLNHGGQGSGATFNCQPNYISVMNYLYQFSKTDGGFVTGRALDYRGSSAINLNETKLSEINGIPAYSIGGVRQSAVIGGWTGTAAIPPTVVTTGGFADFDNDGETAATGDTDHEAVAGFSQNIHYFTTISDCHDTTIKSSMIATPDWVNINFNMRSSTNFASGFTTAVTTTGPNANIDLTSTTVAANLHDNGLPQPAPVPVAFDDRYSLNEDTGLSVLSPGVLANDTTTLPRTAVLDTSTAHGVLLLNADGSFEYTPASNYFGADSFTYHANDGLANSNTATVTITVNPMPDAPVAADQTDYINQNTETVLDLTATDPDGGGNLAITITQQPTHGTITGTVDNDPNLLEIKYKPFLNFVGTDTLQYKVKDTTGLYSNIATVTIQVAQVITPPPPTLRAEKTGVISDIKYIETPSLNALVIKKLDNAAQHVTKSVSRELWNADGTHLSDTLGRKVFIQEEKAVKHLMDSIMVKHSDDSDLKDNSDDEAADDAEDVITTTPTSGFKTQVMSIINHLEDLDKRIANVAIIDANTHLTQLTGHAPAKTIKKITDEINKANTEMLKAQTDINKGDFHRAIMHYKEAWVHAEMAIGIN